MRIIEKLEIFLCALSAFIVCIVGLYFKWPISNIYKSVFISVVIFFIFGIVAKWIILSVIKEVEEKEKNQEEENNLLTGEEEKQPSLSDESEKIYEFAKNSNEEGLSTENEEIPDDEFDDSLFDMDNNREEQ